MQITVKSILLWFSGSTCISLAYFKATQYLKIFFLLVVSVAVWLCGCACIRCICIWLWVGG